MRLTQNDSPKRRSNPHEGKQTNHVRSFTRCALVLTISHYEQLLEAQEQKCRPTAAELTSIAYMPDGEHVCLAW